MLVPLMLALLSMASAIGGHPKCQALETYQAPYVASSYNMSKHMGFYYELGFRDLYPGPPECDCQHTTKSLDTGSNFHEWFSFQCGPNPQRQMNLDNLITLNSTSSSPAVFSQTIVKSMGVGIPKFMDSPFNTVTIAFNDTGADQYEWVVEFTCGGLPLLFRDGFVGINLYSRTLSDDNLQSMLAAIKSVNLSWVLETGFHIPPHNTSVCKYPPPPPTAAEPLLAVPPPAVSSVAAQPTEALAVAKRLEIPNPICMARFCGREIVACERERDSCAKGLSCTAQCSAHNNTLGCLYSCLNSYEDDTYSAFVHCAITEHKCVTPTQPDGQISQCKKPASVAQFNQSALNGRWFIPVGLNPVIDCYDCQYGDWSPSGAHFEFKVPMIQGGFRNRTLDEVIGSDLGIGRLQLLAQADGLNQRQNFTVLAAREDVIMAYWCADNNIGNLIDGVNIFTKTKQLPADAVDWIRAASQKAGLSYDNFCHVDNTNCSYA